MVEEEAMALRIFVGEADREGGEPLYRHIVKTLRSRGLWGATAVRGLYGFGKKSVLHAAVPMRLSTDLPIVIEAVDKEAKIRAVLPEVAPMVKEGLVTLERVVVVTWVE